MQTLRTDENTDKRKSGALSRGNRYCFNFLQFKFMMHIDVNVCDEDSKYLFFKLQKCLHFHFCIELENVFVIILSFSLKISSAPEDGSANPLCMVCLGLLMN